MSQKWTLLTRGLAALVAAALLGAFTVGVVAAKEFEAEGTVLDVQPNSVTLNSASLDGTTRPLVFDTTRLPGVELTVGTTASIQADTIDGRLVMLQLNGLDVNNRGVNGEHQAAFNPGQATDDENHSNDGGHKVKDDKDKAK